MAIRYNETRQPKMFDAPSVKIWPDPIPVTVSHKPVEKRGRGRPPSGKSTVNIRLYDTVLAHYRATGPGWQSRLNDALRKAIGLM